VSTTIWIAVAVIGCVWLLIVVREVRYLSQTAPAQPAPDRLAWIDDRARTETDMSRRAAWRSLRRAVQEEDEL
jgi:hypothetical protein